MSSMQNGPRIQNSLFTACRLPAVIAPGNFRWLCMAGEFNHGALVEVVDFDAPPP